MSERPISPLRPYTFGSDIAGDLVPSFSKNAIRDTTDRLPMLPGGNAPISDKQTSLASRESGRRALTKVRGGCLDR